MQQKVEIPEGGETRSDHRQHHTFIVALRHRDCSKNMTTGTLQADMTITMVCLSTRPTVQRETIVPVT